MEISAVNGYSQNPNVSFGINYRPEYLKNGRIYYKNFNLIRKVYGDGINRISTSTNKKGKTLSFSTYKLGLENTIFNIYNLPIKNLPIKEINPITGKIIVYRDGVSPLNKLSTLGEPTCNVLKYDAGGNLIGRIMTHDGYYIFEPKKMSLAKKFKVAIQDGGISRFFRMLFNRELPINCSHYDSDLKLIRQSDLASNLTIEEVLSQKNINAMEEFVSAR